MATKIPAICAECGKKFMADPRGPAKNSQSARFCRAVCRQTFHNRRAARGSEVYDLLMSVDDLSDVVGTLGILVSAYRSADQKKRGGRPSYAAGAAPEYDWRKGDGR